MPYKSKRKQLRYQRRWMRERRERWIHENGPCVRCGSEKNLEVDHIDPDRKASHRVWSWSKKRREAELAKCQVLCELCHRQKSAREQMGERNTSAKLTRDQVWEIHERASRGETQTSIAHDVPVGRRAVSRIVRGARWPHVYRAFHEEGAA